jgi:hypothetical protein
MPMKGVPEKRERQYEHIRDSEIKEEGRSKEDAARIAAATVNKTRKQHGETKEQQGKD